MGILSLVTWPGVCAHGTIDLSVYWYLQVSKSDCGQSGALILLNQARYRTGLRVQAMQAAAPWLPSKRPCLREACVNLASACDMLIESGL